MKIRSLSNLLYFPLFIIAIGFFYFTYGDNTNSFLWIFVPIVLIIAIYMGQSQIDYWWLARNPVPLDAPIKNWLSRFGIFYNSLDDKQREDYEQRLSNYLFAREFSLVGKTENRDLPEDIKAIIASQAINLTFGQDDYLLDDYDRIFLYAHPFPSPQFQFLHTMEAEHNDKVLILALDHAVHGVVNPKEHYNIALHAYSEAFMHVHPTKEFPEVHQEGWEPVEAVLGMTKTFILHTCGFEVVDLKAVHIVSYFTDKEKYRQLCPLPAAEFERIFKL